MAHQKKWRPQAPFVMRDLDGQPFSLRAARRLRRVSVAPVSVVVVDVADDPPVVLVAVLLLAAPLPAGLGPCVSLMLLGLPFVPLSCGVAPGV